MELKQKRKLFEIQKKTIDYSGRFKNLQKDLNEAFEEFPTIYRVSAWLVLCIIRRELWADLGELENEN